MTGGYPVKPGPPATAIFGAVALGSLAATAAGAALLVHWLGWIALPVGLPLVWVALLAKGALLTIVTEWLGLPAERDPARS